MTFFALVIVIATKEADFAEHFSGPIDGIKKSDSEMFLVFWFACKKKY